MKRQLNMEEIEKIVKSQDFQNLNAEIEHLSEIMTCYELTKEAAKYVSSISTQVKNYMLKSTDLSKSLMARAIMEDSAELICRIFDFGLLADTLMDISNEEKSDDNTRKKSDISGSADHGDSSMEMES